jgi:acyl-CoA dehydrogenase
MDFEYSPKVSALRHKVREFIDTYIEPNEHEFEQQLAKNPWETPEIVQRLKPEARKQGLWNLFLPQVYGQHSAGLTNAEYAPLAEQMGRVTWAS